jgi:hypothetical protein
MDTHGISLRNAALLRILRVNPQLLLLRLN